MRKAQGGRHPGLHLNPKCVGNIGRSDLERAAAAAALDDVRVVEDEPALLEAIVEIDHGAIEVGVELLVNGELDAVELHDPVALAGVGVEVQAVGKTAAASPLDTDTQD